MFVTPQRHAAFQDEVMAIMRRTKLEMEDALPFAMHPLVYDFGVNTTGTRANLSINAESLMRHGVESAHGPGSATQTERLEWDAQARSIRTENGYDPMEQEQLRQDLREGRVGLARNRLPVDTRIEDVRQGDVLVLGDSICGRDLELGGW